MVQQYVMQFKQARLAHCASRADRLGRFLHEDQEGDQFEFDGEVR